MKKTKIARANKKTRLNYVCLQETRFKYKDTRKLKVKRLSKINESKENGRKYFNFRQSTLQSKEMLSEIKKGFIEC